MLSLELSEAHDKSAELLRMDIDMRNMIVLLLAKRHGLKFADVSAKLIENGNTEKSSLSKIYGSSEDVTALALKSRAFDLTGAAEVYKDNGQLLSFEISMRNQIFTRSRKMLRISVLTFGSAGRLHIPQGDRGIHAKGAHKEQGIRALARRRSQG